MNRTIFTFIHNFAGRNFLLDGIGIFFAQYFPYFLLIGAFWLFLREHGWRRRLFFFAEAALAAIVSRGIITELIRFFYYSPRPFDALGFAPLIPESGNSLPSGHAAFYFTLAMVIFFYNRRWGTWYLGFSLLNGISRIFVGVHWPLDILAGAALGISSAFLIHWFLGKYRRVIFQAKMTNAPVTQ